MTNPNLNVTGDTLKWLKSTMHISDEQIGNIVGAARTTVARWRRMEVTPNPEHYKNMGDIRELKYLLEKSMESNDRVEKWLHTPADSLNGRTPQDLINDGDIEPLIEMLATAESGAYL